MSLGPTELIIILVIVLLLFGTTRLPKLARSLGEASNEFKKGAAEKDRELADKEKEEEAAKAAAATPPSAPPAAPAEPTTPAAPAADPEQITMSRADLEALLDERDRKAGRDVPPPAQG
jgi:sec-independent protein translocase protein TatA